jgi:hypothetical protein
MPVTAADLKFFSSATFNDTVDAGGQRSGTVVQNGVRSNVFPAVSNTDRSAGRLSMRKIYPSITNTDQAALLGATAVLNEVPTDAAVSVFSFTAGSVSTVRSAALTALRQGEGVYARSTVSPFPIIVAAGTATAASASITGLSTTGDAAVMITDFLNKGWFVVQFGATDDAPRCLRRITAFTGGTATLDRTVPTGGAVLIRRLTSLPNNTQRVYGAMPVPGAVTTGTAAITIGQPIKGCPISETQVVPDTTSFEGFGLVVGSSINYKNSAGFVTPLVNGDQVTLWHEAATTAATASNGTAINTGRTNLDQLAIIGSDGLEIVRFLSDGPTPTPSVATVNLAAGTVTPTNVTGWSQPVTVRHRISHRTTVSLVDGAAVTLAAGPGRDFPSNSVLSVHAPLGDLQALVTAPFAQQTWTRQWSDGVIGSPVSLMYSGLPVVANAGTETDRWAIVFTSATAFDCFSEQRGKVASGTTTTSFAPTNPATGAPFFTLLSASWTTGILVGSTLRFNTTAAAAPLWLSRAVTPSTAAGTTTANVRLHGSVE